MMVKEENKATCISMIVASVIAVACVISIGLILYNEDQKSTLVKVDSGKIKGITVKRLNEYINCYYGIPYAKPPIGELRFTKPQPADPWEGIFNATNQPPACWQLTSNFMYEIFGSIIDAIPEWKDFPINGDVSEDCLYLNIYAPANLNENSNKTVMVWIHGGAFYFGSANTPLYDGATLAAHSDVIVIAINYRLGIFGFMASDEDQLKGNYGLYDQVLALKWIKQNIRSFGGNPDNIVLFGESAGGISVGYHLVSKVSEGLFSRAILQSGNAVTPIALAGRELQRNATIDVMKAASCLEDGENTTQEISNSSLFCLRQMNATDLFQIQQNVSKSRIGAFFPVEDNEFFTEHPYDLVIKKKFTSKNQILIGSNSVEGAHFARYGPFAKFWSSEKIPENFTTQTFIDFLEEKAPESYKSMVSLAVDEAFDGIVDDKNPEHVWDRYIKIIGDIIFICPDYVFINGYSSQERKVYYYHYETRASFAPMSPKWAKGAIHGAEIPIVFGLPLVAQRKLYTAEEVEFSKKIMSMWTQFAKTGDPTRDKSWLLYDPNQPSYMSLNVSNNSMKEGFPGLRCEEYYNKFYTSARSFVQSGKKLPDFQ